MSQFFPPPVGAGAAVMTALILRETTALPQLVISALGLAAAVVVATAWLASPLPNGSMVVGAGSDGDE